MEDEIIHLLSQIIFSVKKILSAILFITFMFSSQRIPIFRQQDHIRDCSLRVLSRQRQNCQEIQGIIFQKESRATQV